MCCLNAPYTIILSWIMYDWGDDDVDETICRKICCDTLFYGLLPICLVLDIISLPFHLLNVMLRTYLHRPYSGYYFYDVIFRTKPGVEPIEGFLGREPSVEDFNSHMMP